MSNAEIIMYQARQNKDLAMEVYCELYIYTHYTPEQVGVDVQLYNLQKPKENISWLDNLIYRLTCIFKRRGVHVQIDSSDIKDLIDSKVDLSKLVSLT